MKTHNAFALDITTDKPTFVNEYGTRWWLISYGSHLDDTPNKDDGAVYRVLTKSGEDNYVVVHEGGVVHENKSLESCLFKVDEHFLRRTK